MIQDDAHFMEIKARNKNSSCNAQTLPPPAFLSRSCLCQDSSVPFFSPRSTSLPHPLSPSIFLLSPSLHPLVLLLSERIRTLLTSDLNQDPPQSYPGVGNEVGRQEIGAPPPFFHSLNKRGRSFSLCEQHIKIFPRVPEGVTRLYTGNMTCKVYIFVHKQHKADAVGFMTTVICDASLWIYGNQQ